MEIYRKGLPQLPVQLRDLKSVQKPSKYKKKSDLSACDRGSASLQRGLGLCIVTARFLDSEIVSKSIDIELIVAFVVTSISKSKENRSTSKSQGKSIAIEIAREISIAIEIDNE